jgi:type I restriction enzyme S subunit
MGVSHVDVSTNQQINAVCCPLEFSGYAYVACISILDEILANAGRQAVPIINKTTFSSLEIPLLSPVEMKDINETVLALDEEVTTARQAIHQLRQLKACVCSDLLSGRVRVPA